MSSTLKLAREVGQLLDRDTIMALQVKQDLGETCLREIFELSPPQEPLDIETDDLKEDEETLDVMVRCFDLATVLAAYRKAGKS